MPNLVNDLRHSIRTLMGNPGFAAATVLMLALGIGACTGIFTVVNAVLLRPLSYPDSQSLVQLWELSDKGRMMRLPEANFLDWKAQSRSFEEMAIFGGAVHPITAGTKPVRARVTDVSRGFFDIFKVPAMIGTTFQPEHLRGDAPPSIVVSYGLWQRVLGASADLAGKTLAFENKTYSV